MPEETSPLLQNGSNSNYNAANENGNGHEVVQPTEELPGPKSFLTLVSL